MHKKNDDFWYDRTSWWGRSAWSIERNRHTKRVSPCAHTQSSRGSETERRGKKLLIWSANISNRVGDTHENVCEIEEKKLTTDEEIILSEIKIRVKASIHSYQTQILATSALLPKLHNRFESVFRLLLVRAVAKVLAWLRSHHQSKFILFATARPQPQTTHTQNSFVNIFTECKDRSSQFSTHKSTAQQRVVDERARSAQQPKWWRFFFLLSLTSFSYGMLNNCFIWSKAAKAASERSVLCCSPELRVYIFHRASFFFFLPSSL